MYTTYDLDFFERILLFLHQNASHSVLKEILAMFFWILNGFSDVYYHSMNSSLQLEFKFLFDDVQSFMKHAIYPILMLVR